jgi:hypothetical protein
LAAIKTIKNKKNIMLIFYYFWHFLPPKIIK